MVFHIYVNIAEKGLVGLHGFTWVYMGFTWVYMGLHGFTWVYRIRWEELTLWPRWQYRRI